MKSNKIKGVVERNLRRNSGTRFINIKTDIYKYVWLLVWILGNKETRPLMFSLSTRIYNLYTTNGSLFLVLYLKEAHRLIMKALAGKPEECVSFPRVATRRGLPLILPGKLRLLLEGEGRKPDLVRAVLSIVTVYRVIRAKPKLNLSTITGPFTGVSRLLNSDEVDQIFKRYFLNHNVIRNISSPSYWYRNVPMGYRGLFSGLLPSVSAGPNSRVAISGAILDAIALVESPLILESLKKVSLRTSLPLWQLLSKEIQAIQNFKIHCDPKILTDLKLGKLAEKLEAAGKVRIFAICDIWTQSALSPLHDLLGSILRSIEQDGTFDQSKPLTVLMAKNIPLVYSFDLTAATDRLPIDLQVQILTHFMGSDYAEAWRSLLQRTFYHKGVPITYEVGQPMGVLSSFAMLALSHHFIVQIAAMRAGFKFWFEDYALLGDDIVIADKAVAQNYLHIMEQLGVSINLSKSLESSIGLAEFAKRLIDPTSEYSPLGPKNILNAIYSYKNIPLLFLDLFRKGWQVDENKVRSLFDSMPSELESTKLLGGKLNLLWNIIGPLGFIKGGLAPFLGANSLTPYEIKTFLSAFDIVVNRHILKGYYQTISNDDLVMEELLSGLGKMSSDRTYLGFGLKYPIDFLPSVDQMMLLLKQKLITRAFDRPSMVDYKSVIRSFELDHIYDYCIKSLDRLEEDTQLHNIFMYRVDKQKVVSRFKIYNEISTEIYAIDPVLARKMVRYPLTGSAS